MLYRTRLLRRIDRPTEQEKRLSTTLATQYRGGASKARGDCQAPVPNTQADWLPGIFWRR